MAYLAFDIDGTLYDCGDIIAEAFQAGIEHFNEENPLSRVGIPRKEEIISVVGNPVDQIFEELFPVLQAREYKRINDLCTASLCEMVRDGGGSLFEGVHETLQILSGEGHVMLIASNGRWQYIEAIFKSNGLMDYFSEPFIVIDGENIHTKTDIVAYYKEKFSNDGELIMIGDRSSDMIAARENDVPFIGCAFGHAGENELGNTPWIISQFREIPDIVRKIGERKN